MPAARATVVTEHTATKTDPPPRVHIGPATASSPVAPSVAAVLALTLAGCGDKFTEPFKDALRSHKENGAPMDLIRMSDGFSKSETSATDRTWSTSSTTATTPTVPSPSSRTTRGAPSDPPLTQASPGP
jgi:hypothetical protein